MPDFFGTTSPSSLTTTVPFPVDDVGKGTVTATANSIMCNASDKPVANVVRAKEPIQSIQTGIIPLLLPFSKSSSGFAFLSRTADTFTTKSWPRYILQRAAVRCSRHKRTH